MSWEPGRPVGTYRSPRPRRRRDRRAVCPRARPPSAWLSSLARGHCDVVDAEEALDRVRQLGSRDLEPERLERPSELAATALRPGVLTAGPARGSSRRPTRGSRHRGGVGGARRRLLVLSA